MDGGELLVPGSAVGGFCSFLPAEAGGEAPEVQPPVHAAWWTFDLPASEVSSGCVAERRVTPSCRVG